MACTSRALGIGAVFTALLTSALAVTPADAALRDRGVPIVYVGLEPGFEAEGFDQIGLRSVPLGSPNATAQTLTEDSSDGEPTVSPDGRLIAFTRLLGEPGNYRTEVLTMRRDGSGVRRLTGDGAIEGADFEPSFAPSGKRILFVRLEDETLRGTNQGDIYSIRIDGSGLQQITSGRHADRSPVLSPDGRQLVFARSPLIRGSGSVQWGRSHIYSMRPDGSRLRDLTPRLYIRQRRQRNFDASEPVFSPNGRTIAFTVGSIGENILTMRPNGRRLRSLTGVGPQPLSRRFRLSEPAFSPSGRSLLVTARDSYHSELAVIELADRSQLRTAGPQGESGAW